MIKIYVEREDVWFKEVAQGMRSRLRVGGTDV